MQSFLEFNENVDQLDEGLFGTAVKAIKATHHINNAIRAANNGELQGSKGHVEKAVTATGATGADTQKVRSKFHSLVAKQTKSPHAAAMHHALSQLKEETDDKDLPFTPDVKKTKPSTPGKYGSAYSTVRHLARQALKKKIEKEKQVKEETLDERDKANALKRKTMDAARGAKWKVQNKVSGDEVRNWDDKHPTAQAQNKAIGRALRNEEDELEEQAPVAPSIGVHRIGVTVSDPGHTAVSKRNEKVQKFVRVTAHSREDAIERGKKHYAKKGFKVHDAEHAGMVHEEVEIEEGYRGSSKADEPYWEAQEHKQAAEKARKSEDHFSYHKFMSAHHDAMAKWDSNKGRHGSADKHMMKSDEHEDFAQQARKGSK